MSKRPRRTDGDIEMSQPRPSQRVRRQNGTASQAGPSSYHDDDDAPASSLSQRKNVSMSEDEKNHLVATVIRYLLVLDRSKILIQRVNIVKNALDNNGKNFKYIMTHVKETLKHIFGYNLVELEGNKFILTNNLSNDDLHLQFSKTEKAELVLLFITLSHLFMIDESGCTEDDLFDLFRSLDIVEDNNFIHSYFGNVKQLITDKFVKQGYLELVTVDNTDPPVHHYQWGPRAENELTPRHVLEFMSKIFGGRPLNTWPVQFQQMQMRENMNNSS